MSNLMTVNNREISSTSYMGLPDWMTQSGLASGREPSYCKAKPAMPGMPNNCIPVPPEFMHMLNDLKEGRAAYGSNEQVAMAEVQVNGVTHAALLGTKNISACSSVSRKYSSKSDIPARLIMALSMPFFLQDQEFADAWQLYMSSQEPSELVKAISIMADAAYLMDGNNKASQLFSSSPVLGLNEAKAHAPGNTPSEQTGQFTVFLNANSGTAAAVPFGLDDQENNIFLVKDLQPMPLVDVDALTEEQRENIYKLEGNEVLSQEELDRIVLMYKYAKTYGYLNVLSRGLPGTGKTFFYRICSYMLQIPIYIQDLDRDTDADALRGYYAPATEDEKMEVHTLGEIVKDLPNAEDMAMDPVGSYERLTGEMDAYATPDMCLLKFAERISEASRNRRNMKFIRSAVGHMDESCIILLDEVATLRDPVVVTVLNSAMDMQRFIRLTNGQIIHRNPLSIFAFAGNFPSAELRLEGVKAPSVVWQDRNPLIFDVRYPGPDLLRARLVAGTGWTKAKHPNVDANMFVTIWPELQKSSSGSYGLCGFRAVQDWLKAAILLDDAGAAAECTIIPRSTSDENVKAEMRVKILNRFGSSKKKSRMSGPLDAKMIV